MRTKADGTHLGNSFVKSIVMRIVPESIKKTLDAQPTPISEQGIRDYIKQQLEIQKRNKPSPMDLSNVNGVPQEMPKVEPPPIPDEDWQRHTQEEIDALAKGKAKGKGRTKFGPSYAGCFKCGGMNHTAAQCMSSPAKIQEYQEKIKSKGGGKGAPQNWQNWQQPYPGYGKAANMKGKGRGMYEMENAYGMYPYPYFQPPPLAAIGNTPAQGPP
eukprot:2005731-Karenia_brevis.AAC.1